MFLGYDNVWFFHFLVPCLGCWQCLVYLSALLVCIVHVSISLFLSLSLVHLLKIIMHFVWWTHVVKRVPPLMITSGNLGVWLCIQGNCCRCIHATLCAWLSWCDSLDPCQLVTLVSPCMCVGAKSRDKF